jgi:hypothetical protein
MSVVPRYFAGPSAPLPADCVVLCLKYCELCGVPFSRKFSPTRVVGHDTVHLNSSVGGFGGLDLEVELRRSSGIRYCKKCVGNALMPNIEEQEAYRAQFPGSESQMDHRALHLPKYDDSLLPASLRGKRTQSHMINATISDYRRKKCSPEQTEAWKIELRKLFAERGTLSCEDMQGVIPRCYTPKDAYARVYAAGFKLEFVKYGERLSRFGRPPKIYRLAESVQ